MNFKMLSKQLLFLVFFITIWQLVYSIGIFEAIVFPSPKNVAFALYNGFSSGDFLIALGASFKHLLLGITTALFIGTVIGLILGKSKVANETAGMYLIGMQSIPSIVWVPLAIMLFGFTESSVVFVVVLGGTFVMALQVRSAIQNISPQLVRAAKTMGVNGIELFYRVEIPAGMPHYITGIRLAWAFSWRALMAGELLSNGPGLGYSLRYAQDYARMDQVIAIIIVIGVIGATVDHGIFSKIERNVMKRWGLLKQ